MTFPVFAKLSAKGDDQHPLYKHLTDKKTSGKFAGPVKWNFQKFLISRRGKVIGRFEPGLDPLDKKCTSAIEKALKAPKGEPRGPRVRPGKNDK